MVFLMVSSECKVMLMSRKFCPLLIFGILVMLVAFVMIMTTRFEGDGSILDDEEGAVRLGSVTASFQDQLRGKLNEMRLEELKLNNATIEEAIEFLRLRSIELDEDEELRHRGLGFVVRSQQSVVDRSGNENDLSLDEVLGGKGVSSAHLVTLSAKNVGIAEALDLICAEAGLKWKVDEEIFKIVISPVREPVGK